MFYCTLSGNGSVLSIDGTVVVCGWIIFPKCGHTDEVTVIPGMETSWFNEQLMSRFVVDLVEIAIKTKVSI